MHALLDPGHHVAGDRLVRRVEVDGQGGRHLVDAVLADPGMLAEEILEASGFFTLEAERCTVGQQVEEFLGRHRQPAVVVVHVFIHESPPVALTGWGISKPVASSSCRSRMSPRRAWVLTVPSGMPVVAAICSWDRP